MAVVDGEWVEHLHTHLPPYPPKVRGRVNKDEPAYVKPEGTKGGARGPTKHPNGAQRLRLDVFWAGLEAQSERLLDALRHANHSRDTGRYPCQDGCRTCGDAASAGYAVEEIP